MNFSQFLLILRNVSNQIGQVVQKLNETRIDSMVILQASFFPQQSRVD
jgi:hypothetical protein